MSPASKAIEEVAVRYRTLRRVMYITANVSERRKLGLGKGLFASQARHHFREVQRRFR